jgi:hypothetical protein
LLAFLTSGWKNARTEKPLRAGGVPGKNPQGSADCTLRYMYHGVRVDAKVTLG